MIKADSSVLVPLDWKAVDPSSADVDLTILWTDQPFARVLVNGNAAAKDIKATTSEGNAVVFSNVPSGGRVEGLFTLLWHTGTSATLMLAGK